MTTKRGRKLSIAGGAVLLAAAAVAIAAQPAGAQPDTDIDQLKPWQANAERAADCNVPPDADPAVRDTVYGVATGEGVSDKVLLATFEAAWVESHVNDLPCGHSTSIGVFQQRPDMGWANADDPAKATYDFLHGNPSGGKGAIQVADENPGWSAGQVAQEVQVSAYPDRYDEAQAKAEELIRASGGGAGSNPYTAGEVCGDGFKSINSAKLGDKGTVHLLWNGSSKQNCVVTLKANGKKVATAATLQPKGGSKKSDSGTFQYYAGPVKAKAGGTCVRWGGSVDGKSYLSPYQHCG